MINYQYKNYFHNAAQQCDVDALRSCLTQEALANCPIDTRDIDQHTVLHALCRYEGPQHGEDDRNAEDVEACVKLLVEAGADLEARDWLGRTPLHVVARPPFRAFTNLRTEATLRLTSLLLRHGADVNSEEEDYDYPTLLHRAALSDNSSMATLLVKAGASVHATNVDGDTPLDIAIQRNSRRNRRAIIPILLRAGAKFSKNHDIWYLQKVIDAGGFKKYEQAHLARLTKTFAPKFPVLPPEMVRHILTFGFHVGFY